MSTFRPALTQKAAVPALGVGYHACWAGWTLPVLAQRGI